MSKFNLKDDDFFNTSQTETRPVKNESKKKTTTQKPKVESKDEKIIDTKDFFTDNIPGAKNKKLNFLLTNEEYVFLKCVIYHLDKENISTICREALHELLSKLSKKETEAFEAAIRDFNIKINK